MLYREKCCAAKAISLTRRLAVKTVSYIAPTAALNGLVTSRLTLSEHVPQQPEPGRI